MGNKLIISNLLNGSNGFATHWFKAVPEEIAGRDVAVPGDERPSFLDER